MKIRIVIPSRNQAEYVGEITDFVLSNSKPENIEEIIIVEAFNTTRIVKVAEKSHAIGPSEGYFVRFYKRICCFY